MIKCNLYVIVIIPFLLVASNICYAQEKVSQSLVTTELSSSKKTSLLNQDKSSSFLGENPTNFWEYHTEKGVVVFLKANIEGKTCGGKTNQKFFTLKNCDSAYSDYAMKILSSSYLLNKSIVITMDDDYTLLSASYGSE